MTKKSFILICLVLVFALILTGCKNNESSSRLAQKTTKELEYFEEKVFQIIIKLEKNEYLSENDDLEWKKILEDAEKINTELDNIMLDLSNLNLANEEIRNLSIYTNNMLVAINSQNEINLLNELTNLYEITFKYLKLYEKDKNKINQKELKFFILKSFNYAANNNWDNSKNELLNAENKYNDMISDSEYIQQYSYNINKLYILIQEYKTAVKIGDFELTKIKFIPLVSEI